jgi:hypothetical protein
MAAVGSAMGSAVRARSSPEHTVSAILGTVSAILGTVGTEGCGVRNDAHDRLKCLRRTSHLRECDAPVMQRAACSVQQATDNMHWRTWINATGRSSVAPNNVASVLDPNLELRYSTATISSIPAMRFSTRRHDCECCAGSEIRA